MSISRKFVSCLGIGFVLCLSALAQDSDVSGTVRDDTGHPIANVGVYADAHHPYENRVETETDGQGHFQLKSVSRAICFVSPKYKFATYVRKPEESSFEMSLQPTVNDHFPLICQAAKEPGMRIGFMVRFLIPIGTKVKRIPGSGSTSFLIKFQGATKEELNLWSGLQLGTGLFLNHGYWIRQRSDRKMVGDSTGEGNLKTGKIGDGFFIPRNNSLRPCYR